MRDLDDGAFFFFLPSPRPGQAAVSCFANNKPATRSRPLPEKAVPERSSMASASSLLANVHIFALVYLAGLLSMDFVFDGPIVAGTASAQHFADTSTTRTACLTPSLGESINFHWAVHSLSHMRSLPPTDLEADHPCLRRHCGFRNHPQLRPASDAPVACCAAHDRCRRHSVRGV